MWGMAGAGWPGVHRLNEPRELSQSCVPCASPLLLHSLLDTSLLAPTPLALVQFVSAISTDKFRGTVHQSLLATPTSASWATDGQQRPGGVVDTTSLVRLDFGQA